MSLLERHRFMIGRLADAFGYDENTIERMILQTDVIGDIDRFFSADGPSKILITIEAIPEPVHIPNSSRSQERDDAPFYEEENEDGDDATASTVLEPLTHRLCVFSDEVDVLPNTTVFFMKNKRPKDGAIRYALDPAKSNDGTLSFGILQAPLESLEVMMRCLYKPIVSSLPSDAWGQASTEQKSELLGSIENFTKGLQESIRSISGGLELRKPEEKLENLGASAANDPVLVTQALNLLQEWCVRIERYLDDSDRSKWETPDSGPDTEILYWRNRMQRLTSITEQLKGKSVKAVISILSAAPRFSENEGYVDFQRVNNLLGQWREIDVQITEAANEAKDNVKYLSTIERFFEPMYGKDPGAIIDALPALINGIKMIHTIARYYGTSERVTRLFMKITNQMIICCKLSINGRDPADKIWDRDLTVLLEIVEKCLQLNEQYQELFRQTKEKLLLTPKGRQFDFSETQIFGKFDLFCRRLIKLMDMFSTMQQFKSLQEQRFEGLEELIVKFGDAVKTFRAKNHDLLDFQLNKFDRDYVDFNSRMNELENSLQQLINQSFENIGSIEQSLNLLKSYQAILHRENLRSDLDSKLSIIFNNYGQELAEIEQIYERFKHAPPIARNMPPVAGNIIWARHLLRKIEEPMNKFQDNKALLSTRESKKIIRQYNKVARTLIAFEYLWYEAWCGSVETAKAGLQATLIIRHPQTNKLFVNFDPEIFQLLRESRCLVKLDIAIPESAKLILLQEDNFKACYNDLKFMIAEYERITAKIIPVTTKLLTPYLQTLELKLRPGLVSLTWTSLNIDQYKAGIYAGLKRLEEMVVKINDIVENRVQKNLKQISRVVLVSLPNERTVTLEEFVQMQELSVRSSTYQLAMRNLEVENAVGDLLAIISSSQIDTSIEPVSQGDIDEVHAHFSELTYQAYLNTVKISLNLLKKKVCYRVGQPDVDPFFEVDVQLSVPSVRLSPSLDEIQAAINLSATAVFGCMKKMWQWKQNHLPEKDRMSYFDVMGHDIEIIKTVLLLTGAMHGTRNIVQDYLKSFGKYDWLWKYDKEQTYRIFMRQNRSINDFEAELNKFMALEKEIASIATIRKIGALKLNTTNIKRQLTTESREWKVLYSNKVHKLAKDAMAELYESFRGFTNKLNLEVQTLDTLGYIMGILKEIREKESSIEMKISPILDMYIMLDHYLPGGVVNPEELEQKANMLVNWRKVVEHADSVANGLAALQGKYMKQLMWDIREFGLDVRAFRKDFEVNGPMLPGIKPQVAVDRLRKFKDELSSRERKLEIYRNGETLFALRPTRFTEVVKTRKDVNLIDQLYSIYSDVLQCIKNWSMVKWEIAAEQLPTMVEQVNGFEQRTKKLPKKLREWQAYDETCLKIAELQVLLPLCAGLSKPSIKPRHWIEINSMLAPTKTSLPYQDEEFCLAHIFDSAMKQFKDNVEEICDGADKQLQIEKKVQELKERWALASFEFAMWKSRDVPVLKAFGFVIEELEEAQLLLQTLLSARHVAPFREDVQKFLTTLSDTADTLEMWVKVQMLWTSLESVFLGGDIAKQMPVEAKKFSKINKDWEKLMVRAAEVKLVVASCGNELLRTTLPVLYSELEKCQKSLEGYLEQKRSKFPRFYFVSNPVLLLILSQGSDPQQMQPYYEKVFDSIDRVMHSKADKTLIQEILSIIGNAKEVVALSKPVKAIGNIEDWLGEIEKEMQRSLKKLSEAAALECMSMPFRQFVNKTCGQLALLGLQIMWTSQCQDALSKARANKQVMIENNKLQLATLTDLSQWCLEDLGTKMNRIKIETLVTVQVHQRDVFADLTKRFRDRKLTDANDFEWLKQTRFSWQPNAQDEHGQGACVISICDVDYKYNNEYLGCKERLVITPLTDRCFITLSQAMGMCLGGAPAGPAGTGKTETVKDLGRALGVFVVVTNCTDQQRFTDMARIFKGLCQAGLWGCFDEFNRIELPVLSVVAQQVLAITNAKRSRTPAFTFPGDSQEIRLNDHVGYFITMNPGYQGRQELPENLKALFRGVAMMVPDREIIIKVKLCSVGYQSFAELARKFAVLYALCEQQLSKQKHYDFGLRNILSVLRSAGEIKRNRLQDPEEALLMSTLRDMNLSKLVAQDVPLFLSLIGDLFPNLTMSKGRDYNELKAALANVVETEKLIMHNMWQVKVVQLYETTLVRHGIMMVGPAGSGKSRITNSLQDALSQTTGIVHKRIRMNPKAIRAEEMFGETDKMSGEWLDGIFAAMWAKFNDRNRKDIQWIICDGPVDALWIENLNTVLDDNKILTLANGDRIPMTDNVKLLFEVEDLRNASPATVSRAGIIFVSESDLDWEPVLKSWLMKKPANQAGIFGPCFKSFVGVCEGPKAFGHLFSFVQKNCKPVLPSARVGMIEGCCHLLDGLLDICNLATSADSLRLELERLFLYALCWAVGGLLETDDRQKLSVYLSGLVSKCDSGAQIMPNFESPNDTFFEFRINTDSMEWERWIAPIWEYPPIDEPDFSSMLVPTVESTRASFILQALHPKRRGVMMTGSSGTAKTSTALMFFDSLHNENMRVKKLCFSSATTPFMLQSAIESELDKRGGKSFGPPGGKKMTVFMDDLSMPAKNSWDDQPTLELVRQLVETSGFCFLDKDKRGDLKNIEDLQYIAAMGHPSGGRQDIPNRLKRHFFIFNMILPSTQAINEIYGQMLAGRFRGTTSYFMTLVESLPTLSVNLWNWMRTKMLPSPSKFHYTFTLRELSRVFQGILRTPRVSVLDATTLVRLWRHESERVYADKLTTLDDKATFVEQLNINTRELIQQANQPKTTTIPGASSAAGSSRPGTQGQSKFGSKQQPKRPNPAAVAATVSGKDEKINYDQLMASEELFFVDFMRDEEYDEDGVMVAEAPKLYEIGGNLETIRSRVELFMGKYNEQYPSRPMNIILFDDAMRHLMRISRCLGMPKGCMLLVGVGGSGKQSLTRLASYCAGCTTFQISITKSYNLNSLLDDIRILYKACGQKGERITFLFTEAEIKDESFMEVVNAILTTGEVPNLIPKDELMVMASELRPLAMKQIPNFVDSPDNMVKFFIDRVRSNLHVVLCMSPVSAKFPERARKFPGMTAGCTIDWYLAWPAEALVAVSQGYISRLPIECTPTIKDQLIVHMGMVHKTVVDSCEEYFAKMRRHVYQTPKSFLQFLMDYQSMYEAKCDEIVIKANRVEIGLDKLQSGAKDVEKMKIVLAEEEVKLKASEEATNAMLMKLELSSMDAKKEADAVAKIKELCQADAERIAGEKADAEEDLAKAQPFLEEAERAANSIKAQDLNELKKLGAGAATIIKLIFDCVSLLKMAPLVRIEPAEVTLGVGKEKKTFMFIKDSFKLVQSGLLADTRFLQNIVNFSRNEKDFINDETVELMTPYLSLEGFNGYTARNASKAAEGLCIWCRAMIEYNGASKVVKPKLEALRLAEARLQDAERELMKAEMRFKACQDVLAALQQDFDRQLAAKRAIEENARNTRKRMEQATSLISGLSGERVRWNSDREEFANIKQRLIGDVALACAFVAYCGPFNQDFREYLIRHKLTEDLKEKKIPFSLNLNLTDFLADVGIIGDWNLAGLPTDPLSIQNGILVTRSNRFPLLIDPQGQALNWICNFEESNMPHFGSTSFTNTRFREQLEYCMTEGKALIVAGVEEDLDPMLIPVLEKQIITKGKSKYISLGGKVCDYHDSFMMYLVTRLPNPHFTPEEQSRCTIVDFTVTQKGLEEQLLGRVIQKEQRSLEESLKNVLEDVNNNTKALLRLDQMLLERLSENTGNLLDDEELINVLADTKSKSTDVKEKLVSAAEMRKNINEKREQYRPVATRGSVLYFAIVDMSKVNCMYQTSLDQFQLLFDKSMEVSEKANLASKRVNNIIDSMTYITYRYINRGLYERDKISFKLIVAFKILLTAGKLEQCHISLFLRAGSALDIHSIRAKPFHWMSDEAWLNIYQLSMSNPIFKTIAEDIQANEAAFIPWYNENEPEKFPVPVIESRLAMGDEEVLTNFHRLLVVRCMREDRTLLAVNDFIRKTETIDVSSGKLPAVGHKYVDPVTDTVDTVYREMDAVTPVIYLLSAGADPTDSIETLARRKRKDIECVSMGEGQDIVATRAINAAVSLGSWVMLQNCHLGLTFIDSLEEILLKFRAPESGCSPDFRLFITTEPHPKFSIGLLHMATKVTNEPPKGLKAGLQRSYTVIVDQDRLERLESSNWRTLLFALCFLHSVVQERRKFGPLGWCVPYEFNDGDLNATIMFLEKHLEFSSSLSFTTLQYMTAEVQYGGRITDDLDRRLFGAYTEAWLSQSTLGNNFSFNPEHPIFKIPDNFSYKIPHYLEWEDYMGFIQKFPEIDSPEVLGLHPNADLTFRFKEVTQLLDTIVETLPKQSSGGSGGGSGGSGSAGKTREEIVAAKCQELLASAPVDYHEDEVEDRIMSSALGGFGIPSNIFLFQEIQRIQAVIDRVKMTLNVTMQAIRGEVVVTSEVMDGINAVFDARVPRSWLYSTAGDEVSWMLPSLGLWYGSFLQRDAAYRAWLHHNRPHSFWLTGFFNPQGFLTAVQQEITRNHAAEKWSLDQVVLHAEVTEQSFEHVKSHPKEGVFVHGLFMDGAAWSMSDGSMVESAPKKLFSPMPVFLVTALTKTARKAVASSSSYGPFGPYECPVYKYPARTDRYLIFQVLLPTLHQKPLHWTLRGVALLCSTS
jgi:dynein heavy chain